MHSNVLEQLTLSPTPSVVSMTNICPAFSLVHGTCGKSSTSNTSWQVVLISPQAPIIISGDGVGVTAGVSGGVAGGVEGCEACGVCVTGGVDAGVEVGSGVGVTGCDAPGLNGTGVLDGSRVGVLVGVGTGVAVAGAEEPGAGVDDGLFVIVGVGVGVAVAGAEEPGAGVDDGLFVIVGVGVGDGNGMTQKSVKPPGAPSIERIM